MFKKPMNRMAMNQEHHDHVDRAYAALTAGDHGDDESAEYEQIEQAKELLNQAMQILDQLCKSHAQQEAKPEHGEPMSEDTGSPSAQGYV